MKSFSLAAAILILLQVPDRRPAARAIPTPLLQPDSVCAADTGFAEDCVTVHGRLRVVVTGNELWQIGTTHILQIEDGEEFGTCVLPQPARSFVYVDPFPPQEMFGDFLVRPREHLTPGHRRWACIAAIKHVVVRKVPAP